MDHKVCSLAITVNETFIGFWLPQPAWTQHTAACLKSCNVKYSDHIRETMYAQQKTIARMCSHQREKIPGTTPENVPRKQPTQDFLKEHTRLASRENILHQINNDAMTNCYSKQKRAILSLVTKKRYIGPIFHDHRTMKTEYPPTC